MLIGCRIVFILTMFICPLCCRPYYKALVFALTHGTYASRKHAQLQAKKMVGTLGGAEVALGLIREFRLLLQPQKVRKGGNSPLYMENITMYY